MKFVFHEDFYQVYTTDPAAAKGRMESIVKVIKNNAEFIPAEPASESDIALVHTAKHIHEVRKEGVYDIAALAAGGAVQAATIGLTEPCFGLIRPPGHHASADFAWGFCYFNNMAIALEVLKKREAIRSACVLDIDMHFGDGTEDILKNKKWVKVFNISERNRELYIRETARILSELKTDLIGISAGFDNHKEDWGCVMETEDYYTIGAMVRATALKCNAGCFAILEGGYNHDVLGKNVEALAEGLLS